MVIDSRLVRQNPWFDRKAWMNIYNFALPSDATSSEVDPDQVVIWPGMGEDKCNLESVIDLLGLPPIPRPKYTWNEDVSDDSE